MATEDYDYMSDSDLEDVEEELAEEDGSSTMRQLAKATIKQVDGTDDAGASAAPTSEGVSDMFC